MDSKMYQTTERIMDYSIENLMGIDTSFEVQYQTWRILIGATSNATWIITDDVIHEFLNEL